MSGPNWGLHAYVRCAFDRVDTVKMKNSLMLQKWKNANVDFFVIILILRNGNSEKFFKFHGDVLYLEMASH